jgi:hypothetical protein
MGNINLPILLKSFFPTVSSVFPHFFPIFSSVFHVFYQFFIDFSSLFISFLSIFPGFLLTLNYILTQERPHESVKFDRQIEESVLSGERLPIPEDCPQEYAFILF